MMNSVLFLILAVITLFGAVVAIASRRPMYSALGLLLASLSLSGLFLMLDAKFLFMAQIIVYVGAVITLILVILMFLNIGDDNLPKENGVLLKISTGIFLMLPFNFIILKELLQLPALQQTLVIGSTKVVGLALFENWLVPFELVSVLLLVALIGAIIVAKKLNKEVKNG